MSEPTTRRRLPDERVSITHKFSIVGVEGYLTVGMYEDGSPGELFIRFEKSPGTIDEDGVRDLIASRNALLDQFAIAISMLLQYQVPLEALARKFRHARFPPQGFTGNQEIPSASSPTDYVFAWLEAKFSGKGEVKPVKAAVPNATAVVPVGFVRCHGDGEHGCGHAVHVGQCTSNAYSLNRCACTGTR